MPRWKQHRTGLTFLLSGHLIRFYLKDEAVQFVYIEAEPDSSSVSERKSMLFENGVPILFIIHRSMTSLPKFLRFALIVLLLGVVAGLIGMLLGYVLFETQSLAFGYSAGPDHENYLEAIQATSPLRRVIALVVCGLIGGIGWFLLARYGKKTVSLKQAVNAEKPHMPGIETVANALLQIVTIGIGSPLGKEGAPRMVGALVANRVGNWFRLDHEDTRLLMAACAGDGFAAIYNIPVAGALFALEVLLMGARLRWIVVSFSISVIAAFTARWGLGNVHQYTIVSPLNFGWDLLLWALATGPLFACSALIFIRITDEARAKAPTQYKIIVFNMFNFTILGILMIFLPELAGNGRIAAQLGFTGQMTVIFATVLLAGKVLVEWGSLRAGAQGGLLTPSLANGALLAIITAGAWSHFFPDNALGAFAIVGASTFLGIARKMPITAIVLLLEMTQVDLKLAVPMVVCMGSAKLTETLWTRYRVRL